MANFVRYFTLGFTPGPIPTAFIEQIDADRPKLVNGTDGSDHVGHCSFGGLKAPQMRRNVNVPTGFPLTGTPGTISCNCDDNGIFAFTLSGSVAATVTLNFTNVKEGAEYVVEVENPSAFLAPRPLFAFAGAGLTHEFTEGDNWDAPISSATKTIWRGLAVSATKIRWTKESLQNHVTRSDKIIERRVYEAIRGESSSGIVYPSASVKMAWPFVASAEQIWSSAQVGEQSASLFQLPEQEWILEYIVVVLTGNWTNNSGSDKTLIYAVEIESTNGNWHVAHQAGIDNSWFSGTTYPLGQQIVSGQRDGGAAPFLDERPGVFTNGPPIGTILSSEWGPHGLVAMDTAAPDAFRSAPGFPLRARLRVVPTDLAAQWTGRAKAYMVGRLLG